MAADGPYAFNERVNVSHYAITQNGGLEGAGGGLSIATGSDDYMVSENFVCGNFTLGDGGGIGHLGLSDGGVIAHNDILFNQSFNQGQTVSGGGVFVGGEPAVVGTLTQGAGDVTIDSNLIKGNQAGGGHGGGIRAQFFNGQDIVNAGVNNGGNARLNRWHRLDVINNIVVNNMAAGTGGGVSMQDTARSRVFFNTVANNDSTATLGGLVTVNPDGTTTSTTQPAGLASETHSPELAGAIPAAGNTGDLSVFSNPVLRSNITWQNRSFSYLADAAGARLVPELDPQSVGGCSGGDYWELGVVGQPSDAATATLVMLSLIHI